METSARVAIAMPSTGQVHQATMTSLRRMIAETTAAADVTFWWENAQPHDRCRNRLIARLLAEKEWTHLLFLDTDVVVESDTLDRLLSHDAPIACAPVPILHRRYGPDGQRSGVTVGTNIMVFDDPQMRGRIVEPDAAKVGYRNLDPDDMPDKPFPCDATGLGLCLIRRDVLEQLEEPWCAFATLPDDGFIGEDIYFLRNCRRAGFDVLVDPSITCDHYKRLDLTHLDLLYAEQPPFSPWPASQMPRELPGVAVAVCVPPTGWVDVRLTDVLNQWEMRYGHRLRIDYIHADSVRGAMADLSSRMATIEQRFEHVLMLQHDIVPHEATLGLLASVEAPVVSALSRRFFKGQICWSFWAPSQRTGQLEAPQNINLPVIQEPFPIKAIEPACALISRDALMLTHDALQDLPHSSDADEHFMLRWSELVGERLRQWPMQAPLTVERVAEVGLQGLLRLKVALKSRFRSEAGMAMV